MAPWAYTFVCNAICNLSFYFICRSLFVVRTVFVREAGTRIKIRQRKKEQVEVVVDGQNLWFPWSWRLFGHRVGVFVWQQWPARVQFHFSCRAAKRPEIFLPAALRNPLIVPRRDDACMYAKRFSQSRRSRWTHVPCIVHGTPSSVHIVAVRPYLSPRGKILSFLLTDLR